jgi:hypothetical protein
MRMFADCLFVRLLPTKVRRHRLGIMALRAIVLIFVTVRVVSEMCVEG